MTLIRLHRLLAGFRRRLSVGGQLQGTPTTGRQGKSAASGRAQVVGWGKNFGHSDTSAGWRFTLKHERFQRFKRHQTLLQPVSAP
jgi:hypothetical protein